MGYRSPASATDEAGEFPDCARGVLGGARAGPSGPAGGEVVLAERHRQFAADGVETMQMSTPEFAKFIESELEKWGGVVKQAKLKLE